ncbi:MAG: hypothetical protein U0939_13435 [Pirellulales bacterium]
MSGLRTAWTSGLLAAGAILLCVAPTRLSAGPRDEAWRLVDQAIRDQQPELALERLRKLAEEASREAAHADLARAIVQRVGVEERLIEPQQMSSSRGPLIGRIVRLQAARDQAPREVRALLNVVMVRWHFDLGSAILRGEGINRPSKRTFAMDDWDPPQAKKALVAQLDALLADEPILRGMPIDQLNAWLETGVAPAQYRPTAFDWAANQVIIPLVVELSERRTWVEERQATPGKQALFADREAFVNQAFALGPQQTLLDSLIRWTKRRVAAHLDDADPSALVAADLDRLLWMTDICGMEDSLDEYEQALRRLAERHRDHESSSLVLAHLVRVLIGDSRQAEGEELAKRGAETFPDSVGARECRRHLANLHAPQTQLFWTRDKPTRCGEVLVRSYNLSRVHLRLVKLDWQAELKAMQVRQFDSDEPAPDDDATDTSEMSPEAAYVDLDDVDRRRALERPVLRQWTVVFDKPASNAWQSKRLPIPNDLSAGCYAILASPEEDFSPDAGRIRSPHDVPSMTTHGVVQMNFWASSMNLVLAKRAVRGIQGVVLNVHTGLPIAGARPRVWRLTPDDVVEVSLPESVVTDAHGLFHLDVGDDEGFLSPGYAVMMEQGGDQFGLRDDGNCFFDGVVSNAEWAKREPLRYLELHCERRSYRAGETVRFRGCVRGNAASGFRPFAGEKVRVRCDEGFAEPSEIAVSTDSFGVFTGSFTIRDSAALNRAFSMHAESRDAGDYLRLTVEEAPRPSPASPLAIQWQVAPNATRPRQKVEIQGVVSDAEGRSAMQAKVAWRVDRRMLNSRLPDQGWHEIGTGTVATNAAGAFAFSFQGDHGMKLPPWEIPDCEYAVFVEATNDRGERVERDRAFILRSSDCELQVEADHWFLDSEVWSMSMATHDRSGRPVAASGKYTILQIVPVQELKKWKSDDDDNEVITLAPRRLDVEPEFPTYLDWERYQIGRDPWLVWGREVRVETHQEGTWSTKPEGAARLDLRLPVGSFFIVLEGQDAQGNVCRQRPHVYCLSTKDEDACRWLELGVNEFRRSEYTPGETAEWAEVGTGLRRRLRFYLHDGRLRPRSVSALNPRLEIVRHPIPMAAAERDPMLMQLTVSLTNRGRVYGRFDWVEIVESRLLRMSVEQVAEPKDHSGESKWRVVVRDHAGRPVVARVEASCFDPQLGDLRHGYLRFQRDPFPDDPDLTYEDSNEPSGVRYPKLEAIILPTGELKRSVVNALDLGLAVPQVFRKWGVAMWIELRRGPYDPLAARRFAMSQPDREREKLAQRVTRQLGPVVTDAQGVATLNLQAPDAARDWQLEVWAVDERGHEAIESIRVPRAK